MGNWVSEEQLFGDDSRGREVEDENFNTSSSDVTQGSTPNEFGLPDEANSTSANNLSSFAVDFSSNLLQVPNLI